MRRGRAATSRPTRRSRLAGAIRVLAIGAVIVGTAPVAAGTVVAEARSTGNVTAPPTADATVMPASVAAFDDLSSYSTKSSTLDPYDPDWTLADEFAAFTRPLPRTTVNRPDEVSGTKVKVLYVVPSFSTDRGRDRSGEIAQTMFMANQYLASQNGGFGVRFDTYQGALDIGYLAIDTTLPEWYELFVPDPVWHVSLSGMQDIVKAHGWDIAILSPISNPPDFNANDLYFLVYEAPAGAYFKTGAGAGGCRPGADALNRGMRVTGAFVQMEDGTPCSLWAGRYPEDGTNADQREWILTWRSDANTVIDQLVQAMRWLPNCGYPVSPHDGELYTVPGTDIVEIRGGFIRDLLEVNDPIASRMGDSPPDAAPALDVRHDTYFHITSGTLAGTAACNGDISHSSLWEEVPLDRDRVPLPRRTVYDRPKQSGMQLHAVYAVAKAAPDHQRDTDGTIAAAMRHLDRFLRAETGMGVRLDTYQGHVDVTYLPLPWTAAEFAAGKACTGPPCPYEADMLAVMETAGLAEPDKQYVFFYEGDIVYAGHSGLCGGSMPGRASLINLADFTPTDGCGDPVWSNEDPRQWSIGLLAGHEMFHALGAAGCPAAGDTDGSGHTSEPGDIMQAGAQGIVHVDPSRNTYWGPGVPAGCTDLSTRPIFTASPNPTPPPPAPAPTYDTGDPTAGLHPVTPFRLIDTRGESPDAVLPGSGVRVGPYAPLRVRVTGTGTIPTHGVSAVSLNVAVTGSATDGYVSVSPCGPPQLTASVNHAAGATASNGVLTPVSVDGEICVRAFTDVHVIIDVNGWFDTRARFRSVPPRRLLDTRPGESPDALRQVVAGPIGGDRVLEVQVTGLAGVVPSTGVGAVSLNVAATNTAADGFLTIYPCGPRPLAANLNYRRGQTVSNAVVAPVSADGRICIASYADADVVVDVNGWFTGVGFTPVGPARLFDTRGESPDAQRAVPVGQIGGGTVLEVRVTDLPGLVPASGVAAVALNVATTGSMAPGFVTVYPCGERPFVASLNHAAGATVSNAVVAPVSASGTICVASYAATDVVVDLAGWFAATTPA